MMASEPDEESGPGAAAAAAAAPVPAAAGRPSSYYSAATAPSYPQANEGSGGSSISLTITQQEEDGPLPPAAAAAMTAAGAAALRKRGGAAGGTMTGSGMVVGSWGASGGGGSGSGEYGSSGGGASETEMMLDPSLSSSFAGGSPAGGAGGSPSASSATTGASAPLAGATLLGGMATGVFASGGSVGSGGLYDSTGGGMGDAHDDVAFIPGAQADFFLLGTSGLGSAAAVERIRLALREKRPDVLLAQLCPTRMRMLLDPDASIFSFLELPPRPTYGHGGVGGGGVSGPLPNISRFGSLLVARWVWRGLGRLAGAQQPQGPPHHHYYPPTATLPSEQAARVLALEYVEAVRMAATMDTRVVLGDRDLPTTISRAWDCLSPGDKAGILLEFLVLALLPPALARRVLRLPPPALLPVCRGSDAGAEVTALLVARHPSLRPLAREAHDYLLSSLQKLDQPPLRSSVAYHYHSAAVATSGAATGPGIPGSGVDVTAQLPRPVVLAVVGRSHLRYVERNWGAVIDRRRLLNPRVHVRRARAGGGGAGGGGAGGGNAVLAWLGRYALPLIFLLGLVAAGALMVRVILVLSAPPHLKGLVTGQGGGVGPAGVLLRR